MTKIINGKKYSTDTARLLASWDNCLSVTDFHWCVETLYIKKTGEYFLYGKGGGLSPYSARYGDGWGSGSSITPLTVEEAKKWAERHTDYDTYVSIFGEVEE